MKNLLIYFDPYSGNVTMDQETETATFRVFDGSTNSYYKLFVNGKLVEKKAVIAEFSNGSIYKWNGNRLVRKVKNPFGQVVWEFSDLKIEELSLADMKKLVHLREAYEND